jgi:signal transduction histidine kinase
MNAVDVSQTVVHGLVSRDGVLIEADPRLAELNARAGGAVGEKLAVPQLVMLTRLAQRLTTLISRRVIAADGDRDVEFWVRAEPNATGVRLTLTGWQERPAWEPVDTGKQGEAAFADADWLWETDASLHLTFVSVAPGAHDGGNLDLLLGQPLTRLFALLGDAQGDLPMLRALAERKAFEGQAATVRSSGHSVRLGATPRTDRSGAFAGFVGAAWLNGPALGAANDTGGRDAFSARLDHALRVPLSMIIANAQSIEAQSEGPLAPDYVGYAGDIATAGRHLLGLVDDLVDLQAIERPDFHVESEEVDLADLARRAAGLLQVRANTASVTIDRPSVGDRLPAAGEFRRVLQILVNLIGNAVRYSPSGSTIWVRAERIGDAAAVIVADQGKGIAAEDQRRIFEKFERVDPAEPGGSGLGLYIARRLARAMDGDIIVDSAPGQGARFTLTLPSRG